MSKHTPGSWTLSCGGAFAWAGDQLIARIEPAGGGDEFIANALLIRATPDLLAACEAVNACWEHWSKYMLGDLAQPGTPEHDALELVTAALDKVRDAPPD